MVLYQKMMLVILYFCLAMILLVSAQKEGNSTKLGDKAGIPCCFCSNGGDGSGACLPVADCEAKDTYECSKVDQCGDFNEERGECN